MRLLGISGTITGSKTGIVIRKILKEIKQNHPDIMTELLDLKDYQIQFCDGRDPSTYEEETKRVIEIVASADFYLVGTPIFQGSITGALKNLFDLIPPPVFRNKVMGFIATGGTYQHYLVIENQLKPIAGYFRSYVAPGFVYAHNDHFDSNNQIVDLDLLERMSNLGEEMVRMSRALTHQMLETSNFYG
ncbi:MAG TPA: NADPH-dependent oxidoreductase [Bacillus bacterium]|uniref:NADPH-dependent FMN reductase n=1 Tax=Siminovitchia fordii TaxID=254759 RepID=UPI00037BA457|nr:NAD(P)H-dependent oxidoreductase [Siminovitchia fordii]HBZ08282.1 NADPH-dependent oxidoreductase [Bacillus sp. (in: firmicutes)]